MKLKGKLVKFVDNCKGSVSLGSSEELQTQLFVYCECSIMAGETGIVLEEERIESIAETFISVLIGDRVVYDIRVHGSYGPSIEVCS